MQRRKPYDTSILSLERAVNEARMAAADARVAAATSDIVLGNVRAAIEEAKAASETARKAASDASKASAYARACSTSQKTLPSITQLSSRAFPPIPSSPVLKAEDSVVQSVVEKFLDRSRVGIEKYGTTLDRHDLDMLTWITHAQEELMDGILYLEKLKQYS